MTDAEIKKRLEVAIEIFLINEQWLLIHNLSEQCITHKLAEYVQVLFKEFNVDCEYNGNVERIGGRKKIDVLKNQLVELNMLNRDIALALEEEYIERAVFPDIIVHHRGSNRDNLLIIEVKKSISDVRKESYDYLKLKAFTSDQNGNDLHYQLGVFIRLQVGERIGCDDLVYFKDGTEN